MLELAKNEGAGPITIAHIAEVQQIPARFLEAILRELKQADYAQSIRGKEGGYFIAKPCKNIPIGDVIRLFEGRHFETSTASNDVLQSIWNEAEAALSSVYDCITLADLVVRDQKLQTFSAPDYSI
jgi:Rrf2 family cysteine metabolism transcriptional repressor